jgi:hypothetical protein
MSACCSSLVVAYATLSCLFVSSLERKRARASPATQPPCPQMSSRCATLDSRSNALVDDGQSLHPCRFNDLKGIDKIANVQAKVDAVTGVMHKNIESALRNTDRIEDIDEKAVVLADSAAKFKNAGAALKRNMRCRYFKMIVLFTLLIAAVLTVIIVPLVIKDKE